MISNHPQKVKGGVTFIHVLFEKTCWTVEVKLEFSVGRFNFLLTFIDLLLSQLVLNQYFLLKEETFGWFLKSKHYDDLFISSVERRVINSQGCVTTTTITLMSFVLYQLTGIFENFTRCWLDPNNRAFPLKVAVDDLNAAMETYKMQHILLVHGQKVGRHQRAEETKKSQTKSNRWWTREDKVVVND